jgi:hypothetical protein
MARRTGSADLPLHGGRVPPWLATRMSSLGAVITQAIVHHYGRDEFLQRLSHPFWFQSFGAVMGMDWHSSGITTSVIGALKRGLGPLSNELGIHVCGGRGQHSRKTPDELRLLGERIGIDGAKLTRASRLVAKVDSAAVQDGFDLYLHGFFVTDDGKWTVVQQGMNGDKKQARRYHWHSENGRVLSTNHTAPLTGRCRVKSLISRINGRRLPARSNSTYWETSARIASSANWRRSRVKRRRKHCCRTSSCRRITTCGRATSSRGGCMARSQPQPSAVPPTFPICC